MTKARTLLLALNALAGALPGYAAVKGIGVPPGRESYYAAVFAILAAVTVLALLLLSPRLAIWSEKKTTILVSSATALLLLALFAYPYAFDKAYVQYEYGGVSGQEFIPLWPCPPLSELIKGQGSRRAVIALYGPDRIKDLAARCSSLSTEVLLGVLYALAVVSWPLATMVLVLRLTSHDNGTGLTKG